MRSKHASKETSSACAAAASSVPRPGGSQGARRRRHSRGCFAARQRWRTTLLLPGQALHLLPNLAKASPTGAPATRGAAVPICQT